MIRPPAVAGQFYPDNPQELAALVQQYTREPNQPEKIHAKACLVPHAGYVYSGHVAGAVFSRIVLPKRIIILEFADTAAVKRWYNSPEYQKILPGRLDNSTSRAFIFEGAS